MKRGKPSKLPRFASVAEEARFWQAHSPLDYRGAFRKEPVEASGHLETLLAVRFDRETVALLRRVARAKGIAGWLLTVSDKKGVRYVRVDEKLKAVATAAYRRGDGEPNPMSEKETADFLAAELELLGSAPEKGAPVR